MDVVKAPRIQFDVRGPGGEPGFLLIANRDEALEWDIQHEIASTSRYWMPDRQAWWVASYYLHTARDIVHRFAPQAGVAGAAGSLQPDSARPGARGWFSRVLGSLRLQGLWAEIVARREARLARRLGSVGAAAPRG